MWLLRCLCLLRVISLSYTRKAAEKIQTVDDALGIAINLARSNHLLTSLDYFERATQIEPQNSQLWSNMGVTYMRLGLYHLADDYFNIAFDIDPHGEWQQNYEDLKYFVPWNTPYAGPDMPQKHEVMQIPVVHIDEIYLNQDAMLKYATGDHPYILQGAMEKWDLSKFTAGYLTKHFPDVTVDYYSTNMVNPDLAPISVPLHAALADLTSPSTRYNHKPGRYLMMILDMASWDEMLRMAGRPTLPFHYAMDNQWLNTCFDNDHSARDNFMVATKWRMLLVGGPGAGMFNHADSARTASFQAQVAGHKRWHLCSPENSRNIGETGVVDAFNPDYKRHPAFRKVSCLQSTVGPGDMLYYPRDWWHQTEILNETSISLTGTIVDWNNYHEVSEEMKHVCVESHKIPLRPDTCSALTQRCFPAWENHYHRKPSAEDVCQTHAQAFRSPQGPATPRKSSSGADAGRMRARPVMGKYRR